MSLIYGVELITIPFRWDSCLAEVGDMRAEGVLATDIQDRLFLIHQLSWRPKRVGAHVNAIHADSALVSHILWLTEDRSSTEKAVATHSDDGTMLY